jgi:hypothetical protein
MVERRDSGTENWMPEDWLQLPDVSDFLNGGDASVKYHVFRRMRTVDVNMT